jgi:hypothetical protein
MAAVSGLGGRCALVGSRRAGARLEGHRDRGFVAAAIVHRHAGEQQPQYADDRGEPSGDDGVS